MEILITLTARANCPHLSVVKFVLNLANKQRPLGDPISEPTRGIRDAGGIIQATEAIISRGKRFRKSGNRAGEAF